MRLPTEAEWEYASRAGGAAARYGDLDKIAWHRSNSGSKTHEAGEKQANGFGLYDVLGNVWEWVADWYGPYEAGNQTDPRGPVSGQNRALRGGSWVVSAPYARASCRARYEPEDRYYLVGVRCAGN